MARAAGKRVSEAVMHLIYRFSFSEAPTILFVITVYCICSLVAGLFGFLSEKHFDLWGSCFLSFLEEFRSFMYSSTDLSMFHLRVLQTNDLRQFSCHLFTMMYRATGGVVRNAPIVSQVALQFIEVLCLILRVNY